jgi:large repetitive protein
MRVFGGPCRRQRAALAVACMVAATLVGCSGDSSSLPGEPSPDNPGQGNPPPENPAPLAITTTALPQGTVDLPYQASLAATGGTPPYRWTLMSAAPPGLTFDPDGLLTGTLGFPAGTHHLSVKVTDAEVASVTADLTLAIESASGLRVTSLVLRTGEDEQPYADTLTAEGGAPPYTFEWPKLYEIEGLTLEASTGAVSGVPSKPTWPNGEPVESAVTVRDAVGASAIARVAVAIRPAPLVIVTDLPGGLIDARYNVELIATGGMWPIASWTVVSGALPPGLRLVSSTLYGWTQLDGRPTMAGSYDFTLQVTTGEIRATRDYTVVIADRPLLIVTSTLPHADVGTPYSVFLVREGGTGPYQWNVVSGSLPEGIALSAAGEVSGTPTSAGDSSFEVRVQDALGQSATGALVLQVDP